MEFDHQGSVGVFQENQRPMKPVVTRILAGMNRTSFLLLYRKVNVNDFLT
ncbi:hypothetical protein D1BOALGB6SA_1596 [Olavius sp. associated proteobacterium Delta 1]|nr:hypothetical protein D1BOALGB6SA_1596 [Olavius sp. associated proteobacterium Delta 1]